LQKMYLFGTNKTSRTMIRSYCQKIKRTINPLPMLLLNTKLKLRSMLMPMLMLIYFTPSLSAQPTLSAKAPKHVYAEHTKLFNGKDLTGWQVPAEEYNTWSVVNGAIDCAPTGMSSNEKHLWTEKSFRDFELVVEWRIKSTPFVNPNVPIILSDGSMKKDANGEVIRIPVPDSDSGILLRGLVKAQVNIWCWPTGSGEMWGYRTDESMPAEVRKSVTPVRNADRNIGEWNTYKITVMGNVVSVELNGILVINEAIIPDLPSEGPVGLQYHGTMENGEWTSSPSLLQFRNIYIKEI